MRFTGKKARKACFILLAGFVLLIGLAAFSKHQAGTLYFDYEGAISRWNIGGANLGDIHGDEFEWRVYSCGPVRAWIAYGEVKPNP